MTYHTPRLDRICRGLSHEPFRYPPNAAALVEREAGKLIRKLATDEKHRKGVPRMPTPPSLIAQERKAHRFQRTTEVIGAHGEISTPDLAKKLKLSRDSASIWANEAIAAGAVEKFYCKDARRHFYRLVEGAE